MADAVLSLFIAHISRIFSRINQFSNTRQALSTWKSFTHEQSFPPSGGIAGFTDWWLRIFAEAGRRISSPR